MFNKLKEFTKMIIEWNRCRFKRQCEYYLKDNPNEGAADCAYYRALEK